ncbi:MAG: cysteine peptidase family C39 domain-containing protein [Desulfopila sp.]
MNVQVGVASSDLDQRTSTLHDCCLFLAESGGFDELAAEFQQLDTSAQDDKTSLAAIVQAARAAGFQTVVGNLSSNNLAELVPQLPVVAEMKDRQFQVITDISRQPGQTEYVLTVHLPRRGRQDQGKTIPASAFSQSWQGGLLRFTAINTALICFSLIAREHKLDLTRERLCHEYGLTNDEIATATLVRMSKDQGLKARLVQLDWPALAGLGQAWPAMARLKNGRHMVIIGLTDTAQTRDETKIACYDPLAGNAGAPLRLTRQEFMKRWSGEVFLFKRVYTLTDTNQPFSLRWFLPEILRQKTAFFDIGLAVLFIKKYLKQGDTLLSDFTDLQPNETADYEKM